MKPRSAEAEGCSLHLTGMEVGQTGGEVLQVQHGLLGGLLGGCVSDFVSGVQKCPQCASGGKADGYL